MAVTLDNIQFYHGPSKPTKRPYYTFNSNDDGNGTMPSVCPPAIEERTIFLATDHHNFLPATHSEETMNQHTVQSSNIFDLELAKTREMVSSSPTLNETGERGACSSRSTSVRDHQEHSRSSSHGLCKTIEPDFPGISSRSSSVSPSPSLLHADSVGAPPPSSTNMIEESSSSRSTNSGEVFNRCASCDEEGSSNLLSNVSLQPSLTSKAASERSTPAFVFQSSPSDCLVVTSGPSSEPSSDSSSTEIALFGSSGPKNADYDSASDLDYAEQAARCGSVGSHSERTSVQKDFIRRHTQRETKKRSPGRREDAAGRRHTSVAVVIPPPRRHQLWSLRSSPGHIPPDDSQSESSANNDDSDDGDFTIDTVVSRVSNIKAHRLSMEKSPSSIRTSSCQAGHTSHNQSICPEPTYYLTFMPDNFMPDNLNLMPPVPTRSRRASNTPTIISERRTRGCTAPVKGQRRSYSTDEEKLLVQLKERENLTWKEIATHFPGRKWSSLQVHYSTKLKGRNSNRRYGQGQKRVRRKKHR
ncbi:uncharacterized protein N7483_010128 [Penicillium malachiteum]|uniref:uncharacterized protein n=1 Tax=Penicillium malachiteum TaxID=1324776 RepID=UPI00254983D5|nr:uncharacterized protein N7483_010128 [Penicillium malachiteum]KAJ5712947.1 hypothetical protein N7483_010128 [Penicillium malachiteum]